MQNYWESTKRHFKITSSSENKAVKHDLVEFKVHLLDGQVKKSLLTSISDSTELNPVNLNKCKLGTWSGTKN